MTARTRPIAVDLFAGAGGMTLGFEQAGFDVPASVELDPIHCATHEFNFPFWSIVCADIARLTASDIRNRSSIGGSEVDLVFGGPPCQGFSMIGKRSLDDPRNALMLHFVRLVVELKAKYFVVENVPGLTVGAHKKFLMEIISEFQANGYAVRQQPKVLNAARWGVPQNRTRLFLLGCQRERPLPAYPLPLTVPAGIRNGNGRWLFDAPVGPTVADAIGDLPGVENYPELLTRDWVRTRHRQASEYAQRLRGLVRDNDDYSYEREFDPDVLTASLRTEHTPVSVERFAGTPFGNTEPISRFHKLDPNGICNTIRAGTPSNRGAFTSPRPIHPFSPRCITVREAARLHSYPDWFRFHVTKWHGFRQVGNSVPPLLARAVGAQVLKILGVRPTKPRQVMRLGDPKLLELNMSQAAKRYGVNPHVIEPRRRREAEGVCGA